RLACRGVEHPQGAPGGAGRFGLRRPRLHGREPAHGRPAQLLRSEHVIAFRYTVMRLMIFVGILALFVLVGLDQIWALVFAALFSMVTSYFLLAPDRERLARGVERKVEERMARREQKVDEGRTLEYEEDAEIEEPRRSGDA